MKIAPAQRAAQLSSDTVPASKLLPVQLQISEEGGVTAPVSAAQADGLKLAQHHRAEEDGPPSSAGEGDQLGEPKRASAWAAGGIGPMYSWWSSSSALIPHSCLK